MRILSVIPDLPQFYANTSEEVLQRKDRSTLYLFTCFSLVQVRNPHIRLVGLLHGLKWDSSASHHYENTSDTMPAIVSIMSK